MPYHYFSVQSDVARKLEMANKSGTEFGDIDIIFNISFIKSRLAKLTNNRLHVYFTGEMHTAPTGRENRQFIDLLKLLGSVNAVYTFLKSNKHEFNSVICLGGGGWDDLLEPRQKHALKISSQLNYKLSLTNNNGIGVSLGKTLIYAEGNNNKGINWKTGLCYWNAKGFELGLNFGQLNYLNKDINLINQYEFSAILPIKF